jgi:hypothetical protein
MTPYLMQGLSLLLLVSILRFRKFLGFLLQSPLGVVASIAVLPSGFFGDWATPRESTTGLFHALAAVDHQQCPVR